MKIIKPTIIIFVIILITNSFASLYAQDAKPSTAKDSKPESILKEAIDDYILPGTAIFTLISIIVGIFITYNQYRLKVTAERRLTQSAEAENDIKLLNSFTLTFNLAHSRESITISEKAIEKFFDSGFISKSDFANPNDLSEKLHRSAIVVKGGRASQIAAITAICELGIKYPILRQPAINGLTDIKAMNIQPSLVDECISRINQAS